jgi:hypothetical protein
MKSLVVLGIVVVHEVRHNTVCRLEHRERELQRKEPPTCEVMTCSVEHVYAEQCRAQAPERAKRASGGVHSIRGLKGSVLYSYREEKNSDQDSSRG